MLERRVQFIERKKGRSLVKKPKEGIVAYDAASMEEDLRLLNPFYHSSDIKIPVPGQPNTFSESLEAVWQGLKLVKGQTDFSMFNGEPHKRPRTKERREDPDYTYQDSQFQYGSNTLDLITARKIIYAPSYRFLFENVIPDSFKQKVKSQLEEGIEVFFFDWDDNPDIENPDESFAHASLLVELMNDYLNKNKVEFNTQKIAESDPLKIGRDIDEREEIYSNLIEYYAMQVADSKYKIKRKDIMGVTGRGLGVYTLEDSPVKFQTLGIYNPAEERRVVATHEVEGQSQAISNLKKLRTFFTDICPRQFEVIDMTKSQEVDYEHFGNQKKEEIGKKIRQRYELMDSLDITNGPKAGISYYRINDGSYAFIVDDNWKASKRVSLFLEKGTLAQTITDLL